MTEDFIREDEYGLIPDWYRDIYPDGERDGFYAKMGDHSVCYVERSLTQLVITFDNLGEAGHDGYDKQAWASGFCNYNNWSHLGVFAQGAHWFRDANLITYMEKLRDDGFFDQFQYVTLSGASMGAFGALAFSALIPGSTVLAFSPQTTLDPAKTEWETRYRRGKKADWTLPYSDAADCVQTAAKVYVVYDPFSELDRKHAERLKGDNVYHLTGPGFGHKTALFLQRMEALKPVMGEGIIGTLDKQRFCEMTRARGGIYLYRVNMEEHLEARGKAGRIPAFQSAFKKRRRKNSRIKARAEARASK